MDAPARWRAMKPTLLALFLAFFCFRDVVQAQDGCGCGCSCDDGCSEISGGEDAGGSEEEEDEEGYKRAKGSGLAGQKKKGPRDDIHAPKLTFQQQINEAIKRGVAFLKKKQRSDGSWGPTVANRRYGSKEKERIEGHRSGPTSFAIYTLAKCDVPKKDASVQSGYKWLRDKYRHSQLWNGGEMSKGAMSTYECASLILMIEALHQRSAKILGKHKKRKLRTKDPKKRPSRSKIPKDDWVWMHQAVTYLTTSMTVTRGQRVRELVHCAARTVSMACPTHCRGFHLGSKFFRLSGLPCSRRSNSSQ